MAVTTAAVAVMTVTVAVAAPRVLKRASLAVSSCVERLG